MLQHGLFGAFLSPFPLTTHSLFLCHMLLVPTHTARTQRVRCLKGHSHKEHCLHLRTHPWHKTFQSTVPDHSWKACLWNKPTYLTFWKSYWPACGLQLNLTSAREDSRLELLAFGLRKCERTVVPKPPAEHCWTVAAGGQEQQGIATSLRTQEPAICLKGGLPVLNYLCASKPFPETPVLPMFWGSVNLDINLRSFWLKNIKKFNNLKNLFFLKSDTLYL